MNGSTDLALRSAPTVTAAAPGALAIGAGQVSWSTEQEAALVQLGLKDAPDGDRLVFLHQCQRTGLDPFARQIYMIGRPEKVPGTRDQWRTKYTIQTGIDGFRVNRARAEHKAGVRGILSRATFYDYDGNEYKVWVRREPPAACEITYTVRDADGGETPYTSVLRYSEYVQTRQENGQRVPVAQWAVMPGHMLEKCTEADVYRKAFPQDFSGLDLTDAMPLPEEDAPPAQPQRERVTADQARARAPQRVTAEIIPDSAPAVPDEQAPSGPAAGADPTPPSAPSSASGTSAAFRGQILDINRELERLGYAGDDQREARIRVTCLLAGIADIGDLTHTAAAGILKRLKGTGDPTDLEAQLADLAEADDPRSDTDGS